MTNTDQPAASTAGGPGFTSGQRPEAEGRHLASELRHHAESYADSQKEQVAGRVADIADALRDASGRLRERDEGSVAGLTGSAADQLEKVSHALRDKDVGTMLAEAGELARSHPAIFIGGAVALGFMAGRFLRASSEHEHRHDEQSFGASPGL